MINLLIFISIIIIDRITKWWALANCVQEQVINQFCSLHITFNRGISWSIGASKATTGFVILTSFVFLFILLLIVHTRRQRRFGMSITGETLVLAGALSNFVDRIVYHGVIDYIILHWDSHVWPLFNVADIAIVGGAFLMLITAFRTQKRNVK